MVVKKVTSFYTLSRMKKVLRHSLKLYRRKEKGLDKTAQELIQSQLKSLQTAILQKDAGIAAQIGEQLFMTQKRLMPKTGWDKVRDFVYGIAFALFVAVIIRTMWFELYTIPTGSMRPTLKEGDFLVVSKTDYGINVPLRPAHFYFDPTLVQRGGIFVFSGENMDITDADTMYFYIFPGKKLFVKRLMGKPGDTLYFYGGKIYGVNAQGNDITALRNPAWMQSLEHIPFITFDGEVDAPYSDQGICRAATFYQMNEPVAKLTLNQIGKVTGEMIGSQKIKDYSDLWGFKNFAMTRLLTPDEAEKHYPGATSEIGKGVLYLEIMHHPNLQNGHLIRDKYGRLRPDLGMSGSLMALSQNHVDKLAKNLVTCRFIVEKGKMCPYGMKIKNVNSAALPDLPGVADGTYEIQNGIVSKVLFGGITKELSKKHPLYKSDALQVQKLYNFGNRYAYFRDHDLYLFGAPIVKKEDPELILFLKSEYQKQSISTSINPYFPFDDAGPPIKSDGTIDVDFIKKYGVTIPDKMYLALGDNHAMSADSRQFGFVPEDNIRGGPSFVFWPAGSRFGQPQQPPFPHLIFPNIFVWTAASVIGIGSAYYMRRRLQKPLFEQKKK